MHVYTPHTYASHTSIQDTCTIHAAYTLPQILTEYTHHTLQASHTHTAHVPHVNTHTPHVNTHTLQHTHAKLYIPTARIPTPHHLHTHTTARYTHHTRAHRHNTAVTSHTYKHAAHTSHASCIFCVHTHTVLSSFTSLLQPQPNSTQSF